MSIQTAQDIQRLGRIMSVWAHPDDETFSSAGIMASAVKNGQEVICLTATRGEAGVQNESRWPKDVLANIREKELEKALKIIGVQHHEWLGYKDGSCEEEKPENGANCICKYIKKYKPDSILTFGPDGMTGHSDHRAVSTWATKACAGVENPPKLYYAAMTHEQYDSHLKKMDEKLDIFFNIDQPKFVGSQECAINFVLKGDIKDCKYRALQAMPSQTETMMKTFDKDFICQSLSPETFVLAQFK